MVALECRLLNDYCSGKFIPSMMSLFCLSPLELYQYLTVIGEFRMARKRYSDEVMLKSLREIDAHWPAVADQFMHFSNFKIRGLA